MMQVVLAVTFALAFATEVAQVKFTTLAEGGTSQIETARTAVIRTPAEWAALWKEHAPDAKPPVVDFTKAMVLAVFSGMKPTAGHAVEITQIDARDGGLLVTYRQREPRADEMVAQMLTFPFHMVSTDPHNGKVTFERASKAQ